MDRHAKSEWRNDIHQSLTRSQAIFIANYDGMTVEDLTSLRRSLKGVSADFCVVKNTIAKKAAAGQPQEAMTPLLKGQTGFVFAYGDVAAAAKTATEAQKKFEKFNLLGGFMENELLETAQIDQLASLPPREVLIGQIVGSLVAPHRGLLRTLNGVQSNLVRVLNAIKEQKTG